MTPEALDALVASGATVEMIAAAWKAEMAARPARSTSATRMARKRARDASDVTSVTSDAESVTTSPEVSPNDIYSNPLPTPSPSPKASPSSRGERDAAAFPKPDGVDAGVWRDFLANRKRKKLPNTATAHRKLLADLERLVDDQWPPGRILEAVTAKGWGAIYASIKDGDGRNGSDRNSGNSAGSEGDGFTRALRRASAKLEADELGGGQSDFGLG